MGSELGDLRRWPPHEVAGVLLKEPRSTLGPIMIASEDLSPGVGHSLIQLLSLIHISEPTRLALI
eukprot:8405699-Alexandrium_andersonii.AAC.1